MLASVWCVLNRHRVCICEDHSVTLLVCGVFTTETDTRSEVSWLRLGGVWVVSGWCLDGVWVVSGWCLGGVWVVFGWCLDGVWMVFGWWAL
uniref:Uncharacterized protein n=1 Tax=Knipowitschia caucasica TaxID=637954 RepID=A0AAV2KB30_KNICA